MSERSVLDIAADIVEIQATEGVIPTDLYAEGQNAGLVVDVLVQQAEELYELSNEQIEQTLDPHGCVGAN